MNKVLTFLLLTLILQSCGASKKPYVHKDKESWQQQELPNKTLKETLFLVGDAGKTYTEEEGNNRVMAALKKELVVANDNSSMVFLGDNIYPFGMPKKNAEDRPEAELSMTSQLDVLEDFKGQAYFIPGNHDWKKMKPGGRKSVLRQEDFIAEYAKNKESVHFVPSNACGDPIEIKIDKDLVYLFIDTQWYLHDWSNEKKMNKGCKMDSRREFLDALHALFLEHKNDQIVVFLHHPLFTSGNHGGKFSFKQHLFPLTDLNHDLWIPLPVLGSLSPILRASGISRQDVNHSLYQELKIEILAMLKKHHKNVIFASGHEHNLQFHQHNKHHFIVSGSGSKTQFVSKEKDAEFTYKEKGYSKVYFYDDGSVWVEFVAVPEKGVPNIVYREEMVEPKEGHIPDEKIYPSSDELPDSITMAAGAAFGAKGLKKMWMGNTYRDVWTTPIKVPVMKLDEIKGGLTPIKKGGGMSSNSLRLETKDGTQYILRSIIKDYTKFVPDEYKNLKAINILRDQNAAAHPYGSLVLPSLSKEMGIYYTNPQIFYLPNQEGLGDYNSLFPEELYSFEERPTDDRSTFDNFGNSDNIMGFLDVIEKLEEKPHHKVDQDWVLRSRLFDVWVHDWDRHDDQWRWAQFEEGQYKVYRPIPRDRDQVFYGLSGVLPTLIATFGDRRLKPFKEDLKDVPGHTFNGRYFDRYFLNDLDWSEWQVHIKETQAKINEKMIDEALAYFPPEIFELCASEIKQKLMIRKGRLEKFAFDHYKFISKKVNVVGTNERDEFVVNYLEKGKVQITVTTEKKGFDEPILKFDRIFDEEITKEIRLYGLENKDRFTIIGKGKTKTKVRIIGGSGDDKVKHEDREVARKNVIVYDENKNVKINKKAKVQTRISSDTEVNEYNRQEFKYNASLPWPIIGYTPDDGLWLGVGGYMQTHGFRKDPYSTNQEFAVSSAFGSRATFKFNYAIDAIHVIKDKYDVGGSIEIQMPQVINYFGLGNETEIQTGVFEYNWVTLEYQSVAAYLKKSLNSNGHVFKLGPFYKHYEPEMNLDRVINDEIIGANENELGDQHFTGLQASYNLEFVDHPVAPETGIKLDFGFSEWYHIDEEQFFSRWKTEMSYYFSMGRKFRATLANRIGYQHSADDTPFYIYPSIGNNNYIRGFRNDRFRGNSIFYHNIDLRVDLFNWDNVYLPMDVGMLFGFDYGKVIHDKDGSGGLNQGYTLGMYMNIMSLFVLHPYYSFSDEEQQFNFRMGFMF